MECRKHASYLGLKKPVRTCETCAKLHDFVSAKVRESFKYGKIYASLTTPGWKMNVVELLAEMSTCMLHGHQSKFFWRGGSAATDHFKSALKKFKSWKFRDPDEFKALERVLYHVYAQYHALDIARRIKETGPVERDRPDPENYDAPLKAGDLVEGESSGWLKENDGQEKQERA